MRFHNFPKLLKKLIEYSFKCLTVKVLLNVAVFEKLRLYSDPANSSHGAKGSKRKSKSIGALVEAHLGPCKKLLMELFMTIADS